MSYMGRKDHISVINRDTSTTRPRTSTTRECYHRGVCIRTPGRGGRRAWLAAGGGDAADVPAVTGGERHIKDAPGHNRAKRLGPQKSAAPCANRKPPFG